MQELFGKAIFPKQYGKVEKSRENATSHPLRMHEINTLLSMRFNNEPIFESVDLFYSDEYKAGIEAGKTSSELEGVTKFRPATAREANLLYCDLHAREDKEKYVGSGAPTDQ